MTTEWRMISERMERALDCGSAEKLRRLLTGWSQGELKELKKDLRVTYLASAAMLDEEYRELALAKENRHDAARQIEIYQCYREDRECLVEVCMEIEESIRFFLDRASPGKEAIQ